MKNKRVCLLTPGNVASNPRIVKEADALAEAGAEVRVIATDMVPGVRPFDDALLAERPWECVRVGFVSNARRKAAAAVARAARACAAAPIPLPLRVTETAHSYRTALLRKSALAWPADLYIAHYIPALPAAAAAARRHGGRLGFDAEDYHLGELADYPTPTLEFRLREALERRYLPMCTHRTAAAPLIAAAYKERYGLEFETILNVFPGREARAGESHPREESDPLSFYWFSQTIGPGRGLEEFLHIAAAMKTPARLVLRGTPRKGYREELLALAGRLGVTEAVSFEPRADADRMVELASRHGAGLCLEKTEPHHHALCLANKIFVYLQAGIPVILSRTPAHDAIGADLGGAAVSIDMYDAESAADAIDKALGDPAKRRAAAELSGKLGAERYNWDREKTRFLALVEAALATDPPA